MSPLPYVLVSLHKNLQRLAGLSLCVAKAPASRPTTAVRLAEAYAETLQRRVVPDDPDRVLQFISDRGLIAKYVSKGMDWATFAKRVRDGSEMVEAQDCYLSDPGLPSSTGGEREQSYAKTVAACAELGLLAPRTLTLDSYGALLVALPGLSSEMPGARQNPFAPDPQYTMAAFLQVLRSDAAFQRALAEIVPDDEFDFREHLAINAERVLGAVVTELPVTPTTRQLLGWLQREVKNARRLIERLGPGPALGGAARQTIFRPIEDMFLPRLEFWVDAGLLIKTDRARYRYRPSAAFASFRSLLQGNPKFSSTAYFGLMSRVHGRTGESIQEPSDVAVHLRPGFEKFRGRTGYAPITESVMFSNAVSWSGTSWRYVELDAATNALRVLATGDQPQVRVIADRYRQAQTFSLLN